MRFRNSLAIGLVVLTLGGCTATIAGKASPVPGQGPVITKAEPCELLSEEHAKALGVTYPGEERAAKPEQKVPAVCRFRKLEDVSKASNLEVSLSKDLSLNEYMSGAQAGEKFGIGGFTWTRYATILGPKYCSLSTELTADSFVEIASESPDHTEANSCDLAKAAAPAVASKLPGGQQDPQITAPPGQKPAEPGGPLVSTDPCAMLKPEQTAQLRLAPTGEPMKSTSDPNQVGCEWADTDGEKGEKAFDLWFYPAKAMDEVPSLITQGQPQDFDSGGRKWKVYTESGSKLCAAGLAITATSTVAIIAGNLDDPAKACDVIKAAVPLLNANLPPSS
ncbi:DUF3558 family protein [Amycolatopsis sp. NPDC102389]|uniref:DUF3558 family protein n=1 Tax=Amycolatopsis sp. NPDC102389 TaxID=3363941 RepID=UPI00381E42FB